MAKFVKYGDKRMPVEDGLALDDIKAIMARHFPELSHPKVETTKSGEDTVYVFSKQAGQKGARPAKTQLDLVISKLQRVRPSKIQMQDVIDFCIGNSASAGQHEPDELRKIADDMYASAAKVTTVGDSLVRLPTAAQPSGSVL